jgi:hypothetical protein
MNREIVRQIVEEDMEMKKNSAKIVLQHDNAPVHDALRVREFLAKKAITKMDHPPYSSCDFWLFSELKTALK